MIETYFTHRPPIAVLRTGRAAPHLDGFAAHLKNAGYPRFTAQRYLHAAAHFGYWPGASRRRLSFFDEETIRAFARHLRRCRCLGRDRGACLDTVRAVRHFMEYLRGIGVARSWRSPREANLKVAPSIRAFGEWMVHERGVCDATLAGHVYEIRRFVASLGHDARRYTAGRLRRFFLRRCRGLRPATQAGVGTAIRMYLRYLISHGKCRTGLDAAIPGVAQWRLSTLPRYLPPDDVDRLIRGCDSRTRRGRRDRAIILLLARLALRAGDVTGLRFADIDWPNARIRIVGKSRRESRLPLPQEVGDAILLYLKRGRAPSASDHVFLRMYAPRQPLSQEGISHIVCDAMNRAGVRSAVRGAHVLRHSAATSMLGRGASLQQIAMLLRHRSIETTARYSKVHVKMLRRVAQPWPDEGRP